jgi:hypothetical protein
MRVGWGEWWRLMLRQHQPLNLLPKRPKQERHPRPLTFGTRSTRRCRRRRGLCKPPPPCRRRTQPQSQPPAPPGGQPAGAPAAAGSARPCRCRRGRLLAGLLLLLDCRRQTRGQKLPPLQPPFPPDCRRTSTLRLPAVRALSSAAPLASPPPSGVPRRRQTRRCSHRSRLRRRRRRCRRHHTPAPLATTQLSARPCPRPCRPPCHMLRRSRRCFRCCRAGRGTAGHLAALPLLPLSCGGWRHRPLSCSRGWKGRLWWLHRRRRPLIGAGAAGGQGRVSGTASRRPS